MSGYPLGKKRIAVQKETSLRDAVGLVVELFRIDIVEISEGIVLDDVGMDLGDTVD